RDALRRPRRVLRRAAPLLAALLAALPASTGAASAKVYLTQEQALALAFKDPAAAESRTLYLTDEQVEDVVKTAGSPPSSRIVVYYEGEGTGGGKVTAWFDTHVVRTLPETVMVVVDAGARVLRVDILSFDEPPDYLPRPRWLEQFNGRPLDDDLSTKGTIRAVAGATLSSRAITETVRRVLALRDLVARTSVPPGEQP
ncbi:MAG TPA: FMN-binding protein, partial [Candidatus Saccharimonadales bacterium]|nr:FMN-binding protein [Candidatus Saccharimonadales bacterium]